MNNINNVINVIGIVFMLVLTLGGIGLVELFLFCSFPNVLAEKKSLSRNFEIVGTIVLAVLYVGLGFWLVKDIVCEQKAAYKVEEMSDPEVGIANTVYFIKINDEIIQPDEVEYYISESETDSYRVEIRNWYNIMGKIIESEYTLYAPQKLTMVQ